MTCQLLSQKSKVLKYNLTLRFGKANDMPNASHIWITDIIYIIPQLELELMFPVVAGLIPSPGS